METRVIDETGRISLPASFANATVFIEQVSDTEIRIRKAAGSVEDVLCFSEEEAVPLSDIDRDRFLRLIDHPDAPNAALRSAAQRYAERYG